MLNILLLVVVLLIFLWKNPHTPLGRELRRFVASAKEVFGKGESPEKDSAFGEYAVDDENGQGKKPSKRRHLPLLSMRMFLVLGVIAVVAFLGVKSFYMVQAGNRGVIYRFGKIVSVKDQGPHFRIPLVDDVVMVQAERILRLEFGYRTEDPGPPAKYKDNLVESKYLTADNKIVEIDWVLQFQLANPELFLTNFPGGQEGSSMLRDLAEAKMREIVASVDLDDVLTVKKEEIQTQARMGIQSWLKELQTGIFVVAVQLQDVEPPSLVRASFSEVNSAKAEKDRLTLEAEKYRNEVLSSARGTAQKILNDSEAYAYRRVSIAEGEAARITSLKDAYGRDPELVMNTLWLENMHEVWPKLKILVVDTPGEDTLNLLNLGDLMQNLKKSQ